MSWRYVFDANNHYNILKKAAEAVNKTYYQFFVFNDKVYFITPSGEYYPTHFEISDLI